MSGTSQSRFGAKQIAITALLLAICIVSQLFKNLSMFITGPIINACIALTVLTVNLPCAIVLSVITPVTAYFIAGSPIMQALPGMLLLIMGGNIILAVGTQFLLKKDFLKGPKAFMKPLLIIYAALTALAKGLFMGATISQWLLPTYLASALPKVLAADDPRLQKIPGLMKVAQANFSVNQIITALIGMGLLFVLWPAVIRVADGREK